MAMSVSYVPFIGKILPPKTSAELIKRQRLLEVIHRNFDRKIITISAPAGYGKTTTAASFAEDVELPLCWYTLDESDQQLEQFLTYLTHSIQRCFPEVGKRTLGVLNNSSTINSQYSEIIGTLVTEVYESVADIFLLVLDDVHCIEASPAVKSALDLFITQAPDNCRTILLSRIPPSLPSIPRMIVNRQAARLTARDLAFNDEEVMQLITAFGLKSTPEIESMARECEGWVAGIILALLGGRATTSPVLSNDPGGDQEWFNYVMSEVYGRLPQDIQDFLTRTSILYELRSSHCNAILGTSGADNILMSLADSLQLVSRLKGEDLYRYHNLFQSFLINGLRKNEAEFLDLHRRAGLYFMEKALWEAAIHHLCQAESYDEAAEAMKRAAGDVYAIGQWSHLAGWIDRLPKTVLDTSPTLLIHRIRVAVQMGDAGLAMQLSSQCLDMLREGPDYLLAQAHVARAAALRLQGLLDQCLDECDIAIRLTEDPPDRTTRMTLAEAYHYRGTAQGQAGQFEAARTALEEALGIYQQDGDLYHISRVHDHLGIACRSLGDSGAAVAHYNQAQVGWEKLGNSALLATTMNNLGNLYFKSSHLQLADETLSQAASYAREAGATTTLSYVLTSHGELLAQLGQYNKAIQCYQDALSAAKAASEHRNTVEAAEGLALVYVALGQAKRAMLLIEEAKALASGHSGPQITGHLLTSQGLICHISGDQERAKEALEEAMKILQHGGENANLARCYFHMANLLWSQNSPGVDPLIKMINKLLPSDGTEAVLLSEARVCKPFVRYGVSRKQDKVVFQRILSRLEELDADTEEKADAGVEPDSRFNIPVVHAYSLGKTRVEIMNGEAKEVQWPSEKAKEMLFYLLSRGDWARKEEIIDALWPDVEPAKGDTIFWTTAYRLRRGLYPECLVRDGSFYRLNPESTFWSDAREFEDLVKGAFKNNCTDEERVDQIGNALELYKGQFLPEIYSDWSEDCRNRLQDQYLSALITLARVWLDKGAVDRAAELCDKALATDPYQEDAYFIKIRALALAGRVPEAYGAYRRYIKVTEEELSISPSERIVELHNLIVKGKLVPATP